MKTSYRTGTLIALASLFFVLMANDAMALHVETASASEGPKAQRPASLPRSMQPLPETPVAEAFVKVARLLH